MSDNEDDKAAAAVARLAAIRAGQDALLDEFDFRSQALQRLSAAASDPLPDDTAVARAARATHRRDTWVGQLGKVSDQRDEAPADN